MRSALASEPDNLDSATVVVVGKVRAVFVDDSSADKGYVIQLFEILVEKVEKAGTDKKAKTGQVLYAKTPRYRDRIGVRAPVANLAYVEPAAGDVVRVYCYRGEDGTYRILFNSQAIKMVEAARKP
jgi:hypothetical protein